MDRLLSGYSFGVTQDRSEFVAGTMFPTLGVERQSDEFLVYPRGWHTRPHQAKRPMGGEPAEITLGMSSDTYMCVEYALAATLDDRERTNVVESYDPEEAHVEMLTDNHLINREIVFSNNFFTAGKWGTDLVGVATAVDLSGGTTLTQIQQFDQANSEPQKTMNVLKMQAALRGGRRPNVLAIGEEVYIHLQSHPELIERTKYTNSQNVDQNMLANYFGVQEVMVLQAVMNVDEELAPQFGDNFSMEHISNTKGLLLLYRHPRVGMRVPTAGVSFTWRGLLGASGFTFPVYSSRKERAFSDWFAVRSAYDLKMVAPDLGVFCDNAVS